MRTNNTLAARQVGEQIDALQVGIFRSLRRKTVEEAFAEDGLSVTELCEICAPGRPQVSLATTMLTIIVSQQVQYFNVGKTMNAAQVAMVVDDIIDRFGYMTLEEVATAFATARRTAQVYDRLDPNILISWLYDYDRRRDELCERQAQQPSSSPESSSPAAVPSASAERPSRPMTYEEYSRWLEAEVAKGNPEAIRAKADFDENRRRREEPARKEDEFRKWREEMGL